MVPSLIGHVYEKAEVEGVQVALPVQVTSVRTDSRLVDGPLICRGVPTMMITDVFEALPRGGVSNTWYDAGKM